MNRETVIKAGVDYDEGTRRFAGRAQLYEKYLLKFFDESLIDELGRRLERGDIEGAFRTAHDLKGMAGNLSLNVFYASLCRLVELLRHGGHEKDYAPLFAQMRTLYDAAEKAARE